MGDLTWLAVLLLFALSFSGLLWSVLAYFPEWRESLLGFKCVSLQQGLTDTWLIPWCFVKQSCPMLTWTISVKLWYKRGPNSGPVSLGLLVTSQWTTVHATEEDPIMQPYTLTVVTFFTINRAWTRQTGMGQFQCWYCFMFQMKNVKNVYAPSDSSINNIYNRNASCHFWCCIRIYLSFPSWYLPSPVSVV